MGKQDGPGYHGALIDNRGDTEWYVITEGKVPTMVRISRREAIYAFTHDFMLTSAERKLIDDLWDRGMKPGQSILLTAWKNKPDRTLTRILPPDIG